MVIVLIGDLIMKMYKGIKGRAIRNQDNSELTVEQLQEYAPSVFVGNAHESRSERFTPVCTYDIIQELKLHDFIPVFATQSMTRDEGRRDFTRHMIRLQRPDMVKGSLSNEVILLNANDGSSSYQLISGQFRFVCQNGLVMGNIEKSYRVCHKGDTKGVVIDGVYEVINEFDEIEDMENRMASFQLTDKAQRDFAYSAYILKEKPSLEEMIKGIEYQYDPLSLLNYRRRADNKNDMFSTFNVIQENLMKGGSARYQGNRTQAVRSVRREIDINRSLWNYAKNYMIENTKVY